MCVFMYVLCYLLMATWLFHLLSTGCRTFQPHRSLSAVQLMKTFVVETSMFGNLLHPMLKKVSYVHACSNDIVISLQVQNLLLRMWLNHHQCVWLGSEKGQFITWATNAAANDVSSLSSNRYRPLLNSENTSGYWCSQSSTVACTY